MCDIHKHKPAQTVTASQNKDRHCTFYGKLHNPFHSTYQITSKNMAKDNNATVEDFRIFKYMFAYISVALLFQP